MKIITLKDPDSDFVWAQIDLTGDEIATAIDAYLVTRGTHCFGPRTITVNGQLCGHGRVVIDGYVIKKNNFYGDKTLRNKIINATRP